jgi:hypothetical protein
MTAQPFRPGFRIDAIDTCVLIAGAVSSAIAAQVEWWMGLTIGFAIGHFFLFCNVLRAARPLELTWAAVFVMMAGSTIATGQPGWAVTLGCSLVVTLIVVVVQVRKPSYHGVAWKRINPGLPNWWEAQGAGLRRDKLR